MERDNFNPYNFESSSESSGEKKDDKKKAKSAKGLGKLVAHEEQTPKETPKSEAKDDRSFLEKLTDDAKESKDVDADKSAEFAKETAEADETLPVDELSSHELVQAAEAHIEDRAKELSAESETSISPEAVAETEANEVFLEAVHNNLAEMGDEADVDAAVEAAFDETAAELGVDDVEAIEDEPVAADEVEPEVSDDPEDLDPEQPVIVTPPTVAAGGSGAGAPPRSPATTAAGGSFVSPPFSGAQPTASSRAANTLSGADAAYYERRGAARGLLVGGVVGYLIGRRRGRIKTEKRLKVVQEKLEKQVSEVQQKIEQKELIIRKLARKQIAANAVSPKFAERIASTPDRQPVATMGERASKTAERTALPRAEASQLAVDGLSKEELLAYSGQIKVGETSLRRVFEANMIDEKGLRRLIKEYQAGRDLRRALAREFLVKELKFERDPTLRDLLPPEARPRKSTETNQAGADYGQGGAAAVVDSLASQIATEQSQSTLSASDRRHLAELARKKTQKNVSSGVLVGLTLVTISLAIYAIWLTFKK